MRDFQKRIFNEMKDILQSNKKIILSPRCRGKKMNSVSIVVNIMEYTWNLVLRTPIGVFGCEGKQINNIYPTIQIKDEDLIQLRNFLNATIEKNSTV